MRLENAKIPDGVVETALSGAATTFGKTRSRMMPFNTIIDFEVRGLLASFEYQVEVIK